MCRNPYTQITAAAEHTLHEAHTLREILRLSPFTGCYCRRTISVGRRYCAFSCRVAPSGTPGVEGAFGVQFRQRTLAPSLALADCILGLGFNHAPRFREWRLLFDELRDVGNLRAYAFPLNRSVYSFLTAAILGMAACASAEDSLFDRAHAKPLTKEQRPLFGPKSRFHSYDPRMIRAAEIAQRRAHPQMTWHCWKYVKDALLAANVVTSRPRSVWAKDAGDELCRNYGFTRLRISSPYKAPVGAVIVYGGRDAGHVEIRTKNGFVSDFVSRTAYPRPLVGVFVKAS